MLLVTCRCSVQLLSHVQLCDPMDCSTPGPPSFTISQSSLKLTSIKSMMPSNHLILCRPLLLPPSIFPSIRVFSNESVLRIRWPKYWSFGFSISPSNEYSRLISFRMGWLDLLAVQGTLISLLQHHSWLASSIHSDPFFSNRLPIAFTAPDPHPGWSWACLASHAALFLLTLCGCVTVSFLRDRLGSLLGLRGKSPRSL